MELIKPILEKLKTSESEHPSHCSFQHDCVDCLDTGWIIIEGRGAKWCYCLKSKINARLLNRIPPEYRRFTLENILPDPSRHEKQIDLFACIAANPSMSLLLSGKVGCGKSLVGWLLYRQAIEDERPAIALPLAELLAQFKRYECGGEVPALTAENLRTDKQRWFIFLDEFEKARPSEFSSEQLFLLMDAIYTYRHQLVITSNCDKDGLRAHWSQASDQYGVSIMRRLLELDGIVSVDLF